MPFMTENIYQSLQTRNSAAGDTRSVHFLRFPAVKEDYFDTDIERQVKRMQAVIDLARNVRERCSGVLGHQATRKQRRSSVPVWPLRPRPLAPAALRFVPPLVASGCRFAPASPLCQQMAIERGVWGAGAASRVISLIIIHNLSNASCSSQSSNCFYSGAGVITKS